VKMKSYVYFLAVIALLVMVPSTYAVWTITEDWTMDYTNSAIWGCAYNATTGHVLLAAAPTIPIYNANDGTPTGSSLQMPGGVTSIFAIACAEDGVIFAYDYPSGGFYRWADESAAPQTLTVSGLMSTVRCLRAYGSGNDTRIYATGGSDNSNIQLITTDGSNWTAAELIAAPSAKSGVFAVPPAFTTVYGLQPWGSDYDPTNADVNQQQGWPRRFDYTTTWNVNTGFIPEDADPDPAQHNALCVGGDYVPAEGSEPAFIYVFFYNVGQLWALNADTGAKIAGLDYTVPGFTDLAMNAQVDTTNKKIYYASRRSATQGGAGIAEGVFGRLSYSAGPTPTPTPWEAAVKADWQLYQ
jgi:hypothetical protein